MIIIITGENGVGKSTLLKKYNALEKVSLSPQELEISLYSSITSYLRNDSLSKAHVYKTLEKYDFLYITDWDIKNLSNGNKRLLQNIKYLISNYEAIALDEPTNDLDYVTLDKLIVMLKDYALKKDIFIVSHDSRLFPIGQVLDYNLDAYKLNQLLNQLPRDTQVYKKHMVSNSIKPCIKLVILILIIILQVAIANYNNSYFLVDESEVSYIGTALSPDLTIDKGMAIPLETYISFTEAKYYEEENELFNKSTIDEEILNENGVAVLTYIDKDGDIKSDKNFKSGNEILTVKISKDANIEDIKNYTNQTFIMNKTTEEISKTFAKLEEQKLIIKINLVTLVAMFLLYYVTSLIEEPKNYNRKIQMKNYRLHINDKEYFKIGLAIIKNVYILIFMYFNFLFGLLTYSTLVVLKKIDMYFERRLNDKISNW